MFVLMICIIIAMIIVIFAVQNAAIVPVQFLIWSTDLPLVLVIFCSVFAGALLMFCFAMWRDLKHKMGKRSKHELKTKKVAESDPIDISSTPNDNNTGTESQTNDAKALKDK